MSLSNNPPLAHAQLKEVPPQAVEFLQSLILRVRIMINLFEGIRPRYFSILKDSFPNEVTSIVSPPTGLIENNMVSFNPDAPKSDTPNKSPNMANLAEAMWDGASKKIYGLVRE